MDILCCTYSEVRNVYQSKLYYSIFFNHTHDWDDCIVQYIQLYPKFSFESLKLVLYVYSTWDIVILTNNSSCAYFTSTDVYISLQISQNFKTCNLTVSLIYQSYFNYNICFKYIHTRSHFLIQSTIF